MINTENITEVSREVSTEVTTEVSTENITEVSTENIIDTIVKLDKNILIYPHLRFNLSDGGTTVHYYLALILSNLGVNVQIYNVHDNNSLNSVFNNFVSDINSIDFDNTIVIYCEGIIGNPLNAKYVVRWMLSKLGQNVPYDFYNTWNPNELVYFFNNEIDMIHNNIDFKILSVFYINPEIKNNNNERKGLCYTIRKKHCFKNNIDIDFENDKMNKNKHLQPFEINRWHTQSDYINIFNNMEYFISYDPLTFLNIIATLCGCVSIVYPVENVSKIDYFKMTPFYQYMVEKNCFELYGLAYGTSDEEIAYAKNTLHLASQQMTDVQNWLIEKHVKQFIVDINDWDKNKNILSYYKKSMRETIQLFDVEFYKNSHDDLKHMTNSDAKKHYENHGKNEDRRTRNICFYQVYPDFDVDFYKYIHNDLNHMSNIEAIQHYILYGKNEERLTSEQHFYKLYPDFDVDFYKSFNEELKDMSYFRLLSNYNYVDSIKNKKYLEYDFIVNDDYTNLSVNDKIHDLIHGVIHLYRIDTREKLIEYLKQYEKKYCIYNKESFYTYYNDFDYTYYKNKYFKDDNNSSEKDILLYYHLKGKYENHTINNKINIVMYCHPYHEKCGGIVVMHYFCKLINEKYNDTFSAKLFMHNNLKYKNPFCNHFARLDEINNNTIVIYPEIISGNPLNAKHVVRWILLELGIEMPIDHYKKWSESDIIYHWEPINSNIKQLSCPFYNNIFTNKNLEKRDKTCYLIKKGRLIHKNIQYIHPPNSICIDDLSLQEKANIFNECTFFYSYDPNSAYILFSAACGCIPIIYPIEGINEEDYFKEKMFNFDNTIYNKGIVYGNNLEKINYILENKLNENNETYYKKLFTMIEEKTFLPFLEHLLTIY